MMPKVVSLRTCARRQGRGEPVVALAAGADGELADPVGRVGDRWGGSVAPDFIGAVSLVDVVVAVEQDVDACRVQVVPKRLQSLVVGGARAVARLVPQRR